MPICAVLGIPNSEMATLPYGDNTSVSLLLVDGDNTTVEYYNDNRHLPALSTFGRQTWWRGSGSGVEDLRYEPLHFPRDEAFYLQCYRDAWRNVHDSDEGFVPELYARSAARHAQEHPGSVVRVLSRDRVVGLVELDPARDEQSGCGWISLLYMLPDTAAAAGRSSCWATRSGFMKITTARPCACAVSGKQHPAITFYQRSGFVQIGRDPGVRAHLLLMGRLREMHEARLVVVRCARRRRRRLCRPPSFGTAVISRVLEAEGLRVAVLAQPDWHDAEGAFRAMGRPRLGVFIGAGVSTPWSRTTAAKRRRSEIFTPPGKRTGCRPDPTGHRLLQPRARAFGPDMPIILGSLEASLRRFAHYDYWDDSVRRAILFDAPADLLVYGMGEPRRSRSPTG